MKKTSTIRPVLFSMLIIASLGAYIFVNYTALDAENSIKPTTAQKEVQKEDIKQEEDALFLLDVELLKYVFNKSVSYIPTLI